MKLIHERVNLVPIITKADTLSEKELWVLKKRMIRQLKLNGINFHTFGINLATVEKMTEQRQWGAAPFVVSSRRNQDGSLCKSELQLLVNMCLYDRFRDEFGPSDTPATTEKIWKENGRSLQSPALPLNTRPTNIMTQMQHPHMQAQLVSEYIVYPNPTFPSLPPSNHVEEPVGYQAPVLANYITAEPESTDFVSPNSAVSSPYTPTSAYTPTPRTGTDTSAQARLTLIRQSTGMVVDSSTRPNEIMDGNNMNTVHTQFQEPHQGSYLEMREFGVKVEIPHSLSIYQPSVQETAIDLNAQLSPKQQYTSPTLPNGYQPPGTFFVPSSDHYSAVPVGTTEILPDIWEAVESGDVVTVQRHLNNGASPDQRNISRSTLLHRAAWQSSKPYPVMKLLISYGANVNLTNENGNTVLQNVLMKHDDPSLIKLLLDNGAESSVPNKEGMNTLEVAALFNKLESAKYLLENDLSSSEPDSILNALQRARSPDKKVTKAILKSWQGKDGERKRAEIMRRSGHQTSYNSKSQVNLSQQQVQNQVPDATSIHSVDTKGGGNTGSSKASSLQEGIEPASTVQASSATASGQSTQGKHMSRFNLKSNLFGRK
ncbi:hypothetical protein BGX27_008341 [Mortierella sp. AM989]|nr:hypothetical protein BGX27_008341 [Mortierella sp. AM989]